MKIIIIVVLLGMSVGAMGLDQDEKLAIAAIKDGDTGYLKSYLERHPGANCEFSNGKTGLYYAIDYDVFNVSLFLLQQGADPDFIVDGRSTLRWAIKSDRARIARLLIEYGADVNRPDDDQDTPLIYAADLNSLDMCKILMNRGADPLSTNLKGKQARDYASGVSDSTVYKYLVKMEKMYKLQDTVPSIKDGPYINWETEDRIVMKYFEHDQDKHLTREIERTIMIEKADTVVKGFGWDTNSYAIRHTYKPDPVKLTTTSDIFTVGDVHGRFRPLINLLINNKIIDQDRKWIFGNGQLVFLGDLFDRGDHVTDVLWFLYELKINAVKAGGNVHVLLGNHEIMEMTGDTRYLSAKYRFFTRYTLTPYATLFNGKTVLGKWLRSCNVIEQINDYLFLHAGISPQFAVLGYTFNDVNIKVRDYLYSNYSIKKGSPVDFILGAIGPEWYRGYHDPVHSHPEMNQQFVDLFLNTYGLKRLIVGHNELKTITPSFQGKIISCDVGLDENGLSAQGLLISGDKLFRCHSDGTREPIE